MDLTTERVISSCHRFGDENGNCQNASRGDFLHTIKQEKSTRGDEEKESLFDAFTEKSRLNASHSIYQDEHCSTSLESTVSNEDLLNLNSITT